MQDHKPIYINEMGYSQVVPENFPIEVQNIWDDCGVFIEAVNNKVAEIEIEFFVEELLDEICTVLQNKGFKDVYHILRDAGYIK